MTPPPAPRPRAELCILYLHHKDDAVTRYHYALVRRHNPRAIIVPLVDEPDSALPGAVDVSRYHTPWNTRDKWRSCDTMIYRWFENRTCDADYYLVLEYDCRVTVDLLAHYRRYLDGDVVAARLHHPEREPDWGFFHEIDRLPEEDRPFAIAAAPIAALLFSHAALARVCATVCTADVFSELRIGTAIRKAGLRVRTFASPDTERVGWREYRYPIVLRGLYHPVKAVHHNHRRLLVELRGIARRARALAGRLRKRLERA